MELRGHLIQNSSQKRNLGMDFCYEVLFHGVSSLKVVRKQESQVAGCPGSLSKFLHFTVNVFSAIPECSEQFTSRNL